MNFKNLFAILLMLLASGCSEEEIPEDPGPISPIVDTPAQSSSTMNEELKIKVQVQNRKPWKVIYVDSHMRQNGCGPEKALDDNPKSHWHTQWKPKRPKPPHEIQIDMGKEMELVGFSQLPRQDHLPNGVITKYEFYVSNDKKNWGTPASKGSFKNTYKDRSLQIIYFEDKDGKTKKFKGRYFRLVANAGLKNMPFTSVSELNVIIEE